MLPKPGRIRVATWHGYIISAAECPPLCPHMEPCWVPGQVRHWGSGTVPKEGLDWPFVPCHAPERVAAQMGSRSRCQEATQPLDSAPTPPPSPACRGSEEKHCLLPPRTPPAQALLNLAPQKWLCDGVIGWESPFTSVPRQECWRRWLSVRHCALTEMFCEGAGPCLTRLLNWRVG